MSHEASFRNQLAQVHRLTIEAINSDHSLVLLCDSWREIKTKIGGLELNEDDRRLLSRLSYNGNMLARHMIRSEAFLVDLLKETRLGVPRDKVAAGRSIPMFSDNAFESNLPSNAVESKILNSCPLRTWMYRNILFPFPSMPDRRQLQSQTNMPLSNINGWFSNIRRRCGWNTLCTKWAEGDRLRMRELMIGCFKGQVTDEALIKEVVDVIDYVLGKTRGTVGSWLTEIVGEEAPSLSRYTGIKLDFEPARMMHAAPAPSKRRKTSHSAKQPQPIIRVQDDLSDDDDDEDWEDDNEPALLEVDPEQNPYVRTLAPMQQFHIGSFPQGVVSHPYRSFSGSSDGSTISNISSQIHSRVPSVDYSQISGSQYTSSPINNGQQNILPVLFGGPPQVYPFQPELPAMQTSRRPKRGVQQMEGDEMDTRAYKFARFD